MKTDRSGNRSGRSARIRPNQQIIDEASEWFVDFRVGDVDSCTRDEFNAWLRRSPEHIQAYLEIASTYAEMPGKGAPLASLAGAKGTLPGMKSPWVNAAGEVDVASLIARARESGDENIVPFDGAVHATNRAESARNASVNGSKASRSSWRVWALAASIVLMVCGGVGAGFLAWDSWLRGTYVTEVGEQRSIALADGSMIDMNARSRIRVRFTERERRIELLEGQALFSVAKDSARPFVVRSSDSLVRAVGTAFDVNRKRTGTVVTVLEGVVAVVPDDVVGDAWDARRRDRSAGVSTSGSADGSTGVDRVDGADGIEAATVPEVRLREFRLTAGEQLVVSELEAAVPVRPVRVNTAAATAWTHRQFVFEKTPLSEVADEFNRYSARPLVVEGAGLEGFHISGVYSSANPDSLLRFLRAQRGIRVMESDDAIRVVESGESIGVMPE